MNSARRVILGVVLLILLVGSATAEEPHRQALKELVESLKTPDLVRLIETAAPEAAALSKRIAADTALAAGAPIPFLEEADRLAKRDGKAALALGDWLVNVLKEARKSKEEDAALQKGLADAWFLRALLGSALKADKGGKPWLEAAAQFHQYAGMLEDEAEREAARIRAITILHEGAGKQGGASEALLAKSLAMSREHFKDASDAEDSRRSIANVAAETVRALAKSSRAVAGKALVQYFQVLSPIAAPEDADTEDVVAFNDMVTYAMQHKIPSETGYICDEVRIAGDLLTVSVPRGGRWRDEEAKIREQETTPDRDRFLVLAFQAYEWDSKYRIGKGGKEIKGSDLKALAKAKYADLIDHERVKKRRKPSKKRFNKHLPSGSAFMVERIDTREQRIRFTVWFIKLTKAKRTLRITRLEMVGREAEDPEIDALIESVRLAE